MATATKPFDQYENEMIARGMRKITLWVPDATKPEFEVGYRQQMAVLSKHYRKTNFADLLEPDEEDVQGWT